MMRRKIIKIYGITFLICFSYWLLIQISGYAIPCLYLATTGLRCPGCGITRMFLSMFRLDFAAAFDYNPVCLILFFVWNAIGILCFSEKVKFVQKPAFLYAALWVTIGVLVVFGILRNFS